MTRPQFAPRLAPALLALCATTFATPPHAAAADPDPALAAAAAPVDQLATMDLEDLMNLEITSVSRRRQRVSTAPAAVSVITDEDIRRSGMTTIPELLRLAPGVQVARVDANKWAVSSRGFNDVFANKLLVLFDGRTLYSPAFSGVYWDTVDYVLPDLDRVEVIRGPGATLWGANAVNGVINITSRSARDTQGWLVQGIGGDEQQHAALRYGGRLDDRTWYRAYGKFRNVDDAVFADGSTAHDGWESMQGGFRIDRVASHADTLTLQGDLYASRQGMSYAVPSPAPPTFTRTGDDVNNQGGGNLLARWTHVASPTSELTLQLYLDNLRRQDFFGDYAVTTYDAEFQHRFALTAGPRQEVVWGAGLRFQSDRFDPRNGFTIEPEERDTFLASAFVQDDLEVIRDRLHLVLGSKFEANGYTGFEVQPSARVIYTPTDRHTLWASVSRAVRTPNRADEGARLALFHGIDPGSGLPLEVDVVGNPRLDSEELIAWELGYRTHLTRSLTLDAALYFNDYDDLLHLQTGAPTVIPPPPTPRILVDGRWVNRRTAEAYGVELAFNWNVTDALRLAGSYTFLNLELHSPAGAPSPIPESAGEDNVPRNQFQIRSYLDITRDLELNAAAYYVESLAAPDVPGYVRVDVGLTWRPTSSVELSVVGQNLLDDRHPEFGGQFEFVSTEVERAIYGQLVLRF